MTQIELFACSRLCYTPNHLAAMTLDLFQTVPQIEAMSAELKAERSRHQQQLQEALELLGRALDVQALKRKIEAGKTTWLVAGLESGLGKRFPRPPPPPNF